MDKNELKEFAEYYKKVPLVEEPKQKTRVFGTKEDKSFWSDKPIQDGNTNKQEEPKEVLCGKANKFYRCVTCDAPCGSEGHYIEVTEESKQETLNVKQNTHFVDFSNPNADKITSASTLVKQEKIEEGAKWMEERSYSEEDMNEYSDYVLMCSAEKTFKLPLKPKEWFEKFKKK